MTAADAAAGKKPDIYWPTAVRVRSDGDLVLIEQSYAYLRRLNPDTNVASILAEVREPETAGTTHNAGDIMLTKMW